MNKIATGTILGLALAFSASAAQADLIWSDEFERGTSYTVGNGWNEIEGSYKDVSIHEGSSYGYMKLKEYSSSGGTIGAEQRGINATGYENLSVVFKWRPFNTESNDTFRLDFEVSGITWQTIFNQTLGGSEVWQIETVDMSFLGADVNPLDLRFMLDASYKYEGVKIKYVRIYGDEVTNGGGTNIPEPTTFALFGLGLAGVAARRRRN